MRIVSLSPSTTETLFAIGAGVDIVANTYYCDYPEEAKNIKKIGSWTHVDIEKIKKLKADFIFTSTIVQQKMYEELKLLRLPVAHYDPRSLSDIYENIEHIGNLLGKRKKAKALVEKMKKDEAKLRRQKIKLSPRVYIEEWYHPPMMSGNWVPDIVRLASGQYGIIKNGEISREVSFEEILSYDPDYIFLSYCGFADKSRRDYLLKRPRWRKLRAVKEKKIFVIDDRLLNRPGPRVLQAAWSIKKAII